MSEPVFLQYCHESGEEDEDEGDEAEDEQPEPLRSASGPGRVDGHPFGLFSYFRVLLGMFIVNSLICERPKQTNWRNG